MSVSVLRRRHAGRTYYASVTPRRTRGYMPARRPQTAGGRNTHAPSSGLLIPTNTANSEAFGETCIYTGGIAECPAGPYQAQTVVYSSFTDTRACSTCSCGDPTGTCTGQVVYQTGCGPGLVGLLATDTPPGCQAVNANPGAIRFNGSTNLACEGQGGDPAGSVTPLGPVTLCCLGDA